jgi:hypothetical protein
MWLFFLLYLFSSLTLFSLISELTPFSPSPSIPHFLSFFRTTQSQSHTVTQSHSHTLTKSHSHTVTQSHNHTVTQSHSHTVTQSHSHTMVTWGFWPRGKSKDARKVSKRCQKGVRNMSARCQKGDRKVTWGLWLRGTSESPDSPAARAAPIRVGTRYAYIIYERHRWMTSLVSCLLGT